MRAAARNRRDDARGVNPTIPTPAPAVRAATPAKLEERMANFPHKL